MTSDEIADEIAAAISGGKCTHVALLDYSLTPVSPIVPITGAGQTLSAQGSASYVGLFNCNHNLLTWCDLSVPAGAIAELPDRRSQ